MELDLIQLCDGYKIDHRRQYPEGTQLVYSNFTPRSSRVKGQDWVVFFGLQYFLTYYFGTLAQSWFKKPLGEVLAKYKLMLERYLGVEAAAAIGTDHIAALHKLGYIPLRFMALPEGTRTPLRVPMFTVENTHPDFFWVTNYFETLISSVVWKMCTSATTAARFRELFDFYAKETGGDPAFVDWQGHDFSFRGMSNPYDAAASGAGHLLSFSGTDTVPAIELLQTYYGYCGQLVSAGSVPATEHSVMCAGGEIGEVATFERLMKLYPKGILSVVSDTWDFWNVVTEILPGMKPEIMARDGKLVIRPDSGDPVEILCGDRKGTIHDCAVPSPRVAAKRKGLIECLWDIFGGTTNAKGFKQLDPHIGAIYGDSITYERANEILDRLAAKGFASTNVVFGIGSYTYQCVTRDEYGFAMKATWAHIKDEEKILFKAPKDDKSKASAKGRLVVMRDFFGDGQLKLVDNLRLADSGRFRGSEMSEVWVNGSCSGGSCGKAYEKVRARTRVSG